MNAASRPADAKGQPDLAGAKDRPWHLRAWSGMHFSGYLRVLARNRFAVSPSRIPMASILTGISLVNSCLGLLQHWFYRRRIAATELVDDPVFVLGHWRAGTTLLHELLVCDPRHTYPDTYACFGPNHFLLTDRSLKRLIGFSLPKQRPMDNMAIGWEYPQEDEWALCNMGLPSPYLRIMFPNRPLTGPSYLDLRDVPPADRERWKRGLLWFLKCLTLRDSKRIVLKTPGHTCRIRTLLELFPRARFVHIVRDPLEVFPSTIHTWKRMYRYHGLQVPRYEGLEEYVLDTFCRMYEVYWEDVGGIDPGRLWEVRYEDLVADPLGQMEIVYRQLDLGDFESVRPHVAEYVARVGGYRTNRYEMTDSLRQQIAARWGPYLAKYGYNLSAAEGC